MGPLRLPEPGPCRRGAPEEEEGFPKEEEGFPEEEEGFPKGEEGFPEEEEGFPEGEEGFPDLFRNPPGAPPGFFRSRAPPGAPIPLRAPPFPREKVPGAFFFSVSLIFQSALTSFLFCMVPYSLSGRECPRR